MPLHISVWCRMVSGDAAFLHQIAISPPSPRNHPPTKKHQLGGLTADDLVPQTWLSLQHEKTAVYQPMKRPATHVFCYNAMTSLGGTCDGQNHNHIRMPQSTVCNRRSAHENDWGNEVGYLKITASFSNNPKSALYESR